MQYRNADRPLDYSPLERTPAPFVIRYEGLLTVGLCLVVIFICGVLGLAHGL